LFAYFYYGKKMLADGEEEKRYKKAEKADE
jgi:hypothetical protein